jgi:hypothetical protein
MTSISITDENFVNQIDEWNWFPHQICVSHHHRVDPITMCTTGTSYCLTLNGWTSFIKAHSIENNTIYVYKYNFSNWFFVLFIFNNTISVQARYINTETKEVNRIGYNGFLFPHSYSGYGLLETLVFTPYEHGLLCLQQWSN